MFKGSAVILKFSMDPEWLCLVGLVIKYKLSDAWLWLLSFELVIKEDNTLPQKCTCLYKHVATILYENFYKITILMKNIGIVLLIDLLLNQFRYIIFKYKIDCKTECNDIDVC